MEKTTFIPHEQLPDNVQQCMTCFGFGSIGGGFKITREGTEITHGEKCYMCDGSGLLEVTYKPYKRKATP